MDIVEVITIFAIVATNLGTVIALYCQLDRKIDENRKETNNILEAIRLDLKEFHCRLCIIEEKKIKTKKV